MHASLSPQKIIHWRYLPLLVLAIITAVGAALRMYHLGFKSLWFDEAVIYWISQGDLSSLLAENSSLNSAPPLFPALVALVSTFGHTEAVLRALPFLGGVLCIPAMYALARRFVSTGGALASALIVAVAPTQVRYSQELREYSFSVLLAILMVLAFHSFNQRPSWKSAGLTAAVVAVGILMQYGLALLALALSAVTLALRLLSRQPQPGFFPKWAAIQAVALIAAIAVYSLSLRDQWQSGGFAASGHLSGAYWSGASVRSAVVFLADQTKDIVEFSFPGYMYLVLFYSGAALALLSRERWNLALFVLAPFSVVALAGLARLYPYQASRQDLFLTPLLYLIVILAVDYLLAIDPKKVLPLLFLVLMANKAGQILRPYYPYIGSSGVAKIVAEMQSVLRPGDPIYTCEDDPVLRYYLRIRHVMPDNPIVVGIQGTATGPRDYLDQVDAMLAEKGRAWMLMVNMCGDMTPLLDHVAQDWTVQLVQEVEPDGQLYYVR